MHQSLCLDCKILLPAFKKVFIREGIIAACQRFSISVFQLLAKML
jgi:hypothetical protein